MVRKKKKEKEAERKIMNPKMKTKRNLIWPAQSRCTKALLHYLTRCVLKVYCPVFTICGSKKSKLKGSGVNDFYGSTT
jgi:hypothetical protein